MATKGSHKLLPAMRGSQTVESTTHSDVSFERYKVPIFVNLDRVTGLSTASSKLAFSAGLHITALQFEPGKQSGIEQSKSRLPGPDDRKPAKYDTDRVVVHRGTKSQTEHKVRQYL